LQLSARLPYAAVCCNSTSPPLPRPPCAFSIADSVPLRPPPIRPCFLRLRTRASEAPRSSPHPPPSAGLRGKSHCESACCEVPHACVQQLHGPQHHQSWCVCPISHKSRIGRARLWLRSERWQTPDFKRKTSKVEKHCENLPHSRVCQQPAHIAFFKRSELVGQIHPQGA